MRRSGDRYDYDGGDSTPARRGDRYDHAVHDSTLARRGDRYDHAGHDSTPARRGDCYHARDDSSPASSYYNNNPDFGFHGRRTRLLDYPQGLNHPLYRDNLDSPPLGIWIICLIMFSIILIVLRICT